jgi:hypothetical protein
VFLDGTNEQSRGNQWSSSHVTIEYLPDLHPTTTELDVEDINPTPSLLDDGDVEPHLGPVNWDAFVDEASDEIPWLRWVLLHVNQRYGENVWWDYDCGKCGQIVIRNGKYYRNNILIKTHGIYGCISPDNPVLILAYVPLRKLLEEKCFQRFNDKRWYYRNDPFQNANAPQRYLQDTTDKAD